MTDPTDVPSTPSLTASLLHSYAQKAATMASVALLAHVVPKAELSGDVQTLAGALLLVGGIAWTAARDWLDARRNKTLEQKAAAK